ncbi:sensor histidine kinase [Actinoplanes sp. URMC 104]|uniref:sensor histidine kinase n=1 Tax=Actinoplanes sp. URMC 104 TaxID=3423409 RepID=UPI003F1D4875
MRMRRTQPTLTDALLAAALTAGICYEAALAWDSTPAPAYVLTLDALCSVVFAWRRIRPVAAAVVIGVATGGTLIVAPVPENLSHTLTLLGAGYAAVVYARTVRGGLAGIAAITGGVAVHGYLDYSESTMAAAVAALWMALTFVVGFSVRRHAERAADYARRAVLAELARDRHAAAAVALERTRISRELHDVIAHAISVIILHARGGRRMLTVDVAESREAFATVEEVAEQALVEMRRLLGVLRATDEEADLAPQPSLRHLDALVAQAARPDLDIRVRTEGDLTGLPPGVDVTGYRIVQEALTNVLKHADAGSVHIAVAVTPAALTLEVVDDGTGAGAAASAGYGILGMRERAALFGGELAAGPRPDHGFTVSATLPLTGAAS